MSLLNKASLIQIPSGYKDGTLYSAKPTNGDGDFTFSRGSNLSATRCNSEGLIEKGRENLLLQSNTFDTTWITSNASVTSGQSGYDGSSDAWLFETTVAGATVQQAFTSTGVLTYSVYAKAGSVNGIRLRIDATSDANGYYDLVNGTIFSSEGIDASISDVGNGWYKCSLSQNVSGAVKIQFFTTDGTTSYDNGNIYIQDAQLEQGLVATDYIETTTTTEQAGILEDMPRLDYSGGASCPALLLEPQRTNKIPHSEYLNAVTKSNVTINTNSDISPEGVQNAHNVIANATNSDHLFFQSSMGGSTNANTQTIYAKANGYDWIHIRFDIPTKRAFFNVANGTLGTADSGITHTIKNVGNGWYRCSATMTTTNYANAVLGLASADNTANFLGDGTSGVLMYGWQSEEASYPTSYIPTYGSSVTRSADNIPLLDLRSDGLLTGTDYTYVVNLIFNTGVATFSGFLNEVDAIGVFKGGLVWSGGLQYRTPVSGSNQYVTLDSVISKGDFSKLVIRCTGSLREFFYNGTKLGTSLNSDNAGTDTDGFRFYYNSATANFFSPSYSQINVFPTALTDAECIELTTI